MRKMMRGLKQLGEKPMLMLPNMMSPMCSYLGSRTSCLEKGT